MILKQPGEPKAIKILIQKEGGGMWETCRKWGVMVEAEAVSTESLHELSVMFSSQESLEVKTKTESSQVLFLRLQKGIYPFDTLNFIYPQPP